MASAGSSCTSPALDDVVYLMQFHVEMVVGGEDTLGVHRNTSGICSLSLSTTSTTTSTSQPVWPSDIVRDVVANQAVQAGQADVLDLARRLLDRQRRLHHMDRLLRDAVEELLQWIPQALSAEPLNAALMEANVWQAVAAQSAHGSAASTTEPNHVANNPVFLLRPGLPLSLDHARESLPVVSPRTLLNYRRRAWRVHLRGLPGADEMAPSSAADSSPSAEQGTPEDRDQDLFLVQLDESVPISNWPLHPEVHLPEVPRRARSRRGRRRGRERRPPPRFRPRRPPRMLMGLLALIHLFLSLALLFGMNAVSAVAVSVVVVGMLDGW